MKVAVFSGTFDPIHIGHMAIAKEALKYVDEVAFLVEPKPRRKTDITKLLHREAMVKSAIIGEPKFKVISNIQNSSHNTQEVLGILKQHYSLSDTEPYWLMGADIFSHIHSWKDLDNCRKYPFIVAARGKHDIEAITQLSAELSLLVEQIDIDLSVSSSKVRQGNLSLTTSKVADYIRKNKLYTAS